MVLFLKYFAFIILTLVIGFVDVSQYIAMGVDVISKLRLGSTMFALILVKTYSLLKMETIKDLRAKTSKKNLAWKTLVLSSVIYFSLATISVLNVTGSNLAAVEKQRQLNISETITIVDDSTTLLSEKQLLLDRIRSNINTINTKIEQAKDPWAARALQKDLQTASEQEVAIINEMAELRRVSTSQRIDSAKDSGENIFVMFELMGTLFPWWKMSGEQFMKYMLLALSILAEIGVFYTSPTLKLSEKEKAELLHVASKPEDSAPPKVEQVTAVVKELRKRKSYYKKVSSQKKGVLAEEPTELSTAEPVISIPELAQKASSVLVETEPSSLEVTPKSPDIKVERNVAQGKSPSITRDGLLNKIFTGAKDARLPSAAQLSFETGIPVEKLNKYILKLSKLVGPTGVPLIYQKGTDWYMNFNKNISIEVVKGKEK